MTGMSGAIKMERSEHERAKYPDRINLDRKGLHSVPILADEPDLRLISLQHNSIKRIQHLDTTFRLVFLDLYHNRLEQASNSIQTSVSPFPIMFVNFRSVVWSL